MIIDSLQIRLRIRVPLFVPVINHGILPSMDYDRSNVTDLHIFKEWQQFHINQILFIFQSGQLQPGAAVLHIVLDQSRKQDIWILCVLCQKVTFPFYSLFFGRETSFTFMLALAKSIFIVKIGIPFCLSIFGKIFISRHLNPPLLYKCVKQM